MEKFRRPWHSFGGFRGDVNKLHTEGVCFVWFVVDRNEN